MISLSASISLANLIVWVEISLGKTAAPLIQATIPPTAFSCLLEFSETGDKFSCELFRIEGRLCCRWRRRRLTDKLRIGNLKDISRKLSTQFRSTVETQLVILSWVFQGN